MITKILVIPVMLMIAVISWFCNFVILIITAIRVILSFYYCDPHDSRDSHDSHDSHALRGSTDL